MFFAAASSRPLWRPPTKRRVPLREMAPPRSRRRDQPRASGERRSAATMRRDMPAGRNGLLCSICIYRLVGRTRHGRCDEPAAFQLELVLVFPLPPHRARHARRGLAHLAPTALHPDQPGAGAYKVVPSCVPRTHPLLSAHNRVCDNREAPCEDRYNSLPQPLRRLRR